MRLFGGAILMVVEAVVKGETRTSALTGSVELAQLGPPQTTTVALPSESSEVVKLSPVPVPLPGANQDSVSWQALFSPGDTNLTWSPASVGEHES